MLFPKSVCPGKTAQLDHGKGEIEPIGFRLRYDLTVEVERRLVLRRGRRDQPTGVADGDENSDLDSLTCMRHRLRLCVGGDPGARSRRTIAGLARRVRRMRRVNLAQKAREQTR